VLDGVTPGSITLVGQGDPTLSSVPTNVYAGAPTLASLASKTLAAYNTAHPGVPITQVVLDSSYWDPTDKWVQSDPQSLRTSGYLSYTTALQVDGDRTSPTQQVSPRSADPITAAGNAFVKALGLTGVSVISGQAENGAPTLASVQSQPVSTLVKQMVLQNDDTLAEQLARIISVKQNLDGASSTLNEAITKALAGFGMSTSSLSVVDGSGESPSNSVPPQYLAKLMALISGGKQNLQYIGLGLGLSGNIHVKSGSLSSVATLAGYFSAPNGTREAFAFFASGTGVGTSTPAKLKSLATAVQACGTNLTEN
jgi:D-alanyl-D-alanine carboxypeptidase/D-alanyl-D-alanine-endopeptidase (penicillin-binding protein 4)